LEIYQSRLFEKKIEKFNKEEKEVLDNAIKMTKAGADVIVCHMGLTIKGSIGAKTTKTLDECVHLIDELKLFVKKHLAAHQYPREIEFVEQLPKTPSGKVQRFLLKKQYY